MLYPFLYQWVQCLINGDRVVQNTIQSMPKQVAALERAALAVRILPGADAIWDEFIDDETKRLRASLRRLLPMLEEVRQLTNTKSQLRRLLREHQLAQGAIAKHVASRAKGEQREKTKRDAEARGTDEWVASVQLWRELTQLHFQPLTASQCATIMTDAVVARRRFTSSEGRLSSGTSFMGWRDSRQLLASKSSLQFSFDKTYQGCDLERYMQMTWRIYSEQQLYLANILGLGGRGRVCVHIVQELSPTSWVLRIDERYNGLPVSFHELFLMFVIKTAKGAVQFLTCIHNNDLQNAINSPIDMWTTNSYWFEWEVLDQSKDWSSTDFHVSLGGCLRGDDPAFLTRWMCELLAALVRSDAVANDRPTLEFS